MSSVTDGSVNLVPSTPRPVEPSAEVHPPHTAPAPGISRHPDPAGLSSRPIRPLAQLSRDQILDATAECLCAKGYDGTTIRRIAAILGCAVGTIYRYFEDKRQLLDAVTQRRFIPVVEAFDANQPVDRTATIYATIAVEQPELYRLMFWLASVGQTEYGSTVPAIVQRIIDGWAAQLGGRLNAQRFWSQIHGAIMLGLPVEGVLEVLVARSMPAPLRTASNGEASADTTPADTREPEIVVVSPRPRQTEDVTLL